MISVFVERELLLVILQLAEKAFAQTAAAYARRIELANHFKGFLKIRCGKARFVNGTLAHRCRFWCRSNGGRAISIVCGNRRRRFEGRDGRSELGKRIFVDGASARS